MYQALYRKYRPQTFDDVLGQGHITETLKNQVNSGRLSHAYLFIGTRGTGKTTCAKILAKAVNCERPEGGNPCNKCPACRGIDDGTVMDVVEIDAASNNSVDNVRALRDEAVFTPSAVKKRIYIIDEVHMLSTSAFNALLKILEEPPEHLMFILATTELRKIPSTILSRCQRYSFKRPAATIISERLRQVARLESLQLTDEASDLLGRLADGSFRDGLSLLDQCSGAEIIDEALVQAVVGLAGSRSIEELLGCMAAGDTGAVLSRFKALWSEGKDPAGLLSELCTLMRDILILSVAPRGGAGLLSESHAEDALRTLSRQVSGDRLLFMMQFIQDALASIKDKPSPRVAAELCLISLCGQLLDEAVLKHDNVIPVPAVPASVTADTTGDITESEPEPDRLITDGIADTADEAQPIAEPAPEYGIFEEPEEEFIRDEPQAITEPERTGPEEAAPEAFAGDAPKDTSFSWEELTKLMRGRVQVGAHALLNNPAHVLGELAGETLTVKVGNGFAHDVLNKPEVIEQLRACAAELLGRQIVVSLAQNGAAGAATRDLNELKQFEQVKFI